MRCPMIFSRQLSAVIPQKTFLYCYLAHYQLFRIKKSCKVKPFSTQLFPALWGSTVPGKIIKCGVLKWPLTRPFSNTQHN